MKILVKLFFLSVCLVACCCGYAQRPASVNALEQKVIRHNDALQFDQSLELILDFLQEDDLSAYDKYKAYLLKSYTYKRLFDYNRVLACLDQAYDEGMQGPQKQEVAATVKAEKAFAYFDTHDYEKSDLLMKELELSGYRHVSNENKAIVIMQMGYIDFLHGKRGDAENKYDEAIRLMQAFSPRNLPIVYGKKVELYGAARQNDKLREAFRAGMNSADKHHILKYKMYLYETLQQQYAKNKDYKEAYLSYMKYDSLNAIYAAEQNKYTLTLHEKDLELMRQKENIRRKNYILGIVIAIAVILVLISYLIFRLLKSKRAAHSMLEKEYRRIHDELQLIVANNKAKPSFEEMMGQYNLSERQREVISLLKEGKTNKQIAELLFISENTVKYHLKSIYEILQVENRSEFYRLTHN